MGRLEDVGDRDGWRCWLCDEPVDPAQSVNDARGPSIDSIVTKAKAKRSGPADERLAHRGCNTKKGAVSPVVPWPDDLVVADPAPIVTIADRLQRKGGREIVARCMTRHDADAAGDWLVDRLSRLTPTLAVRATVEPAGGQFVVVLATT